MDNKLRISKKDIDDTIVKRLEIGNALYDKLKVVKNVDESNDLKLEFELWDDFNVNYLNASFNKDKNEELNTYNDGIAYIDLMSALNNYDSNLNNNEIRQVLTRHLLNLKKIQNHIQFFEEISEFDKKQAIEEIELFSMDLVNGTRGYIENMAKQIILCYKYSLYDACLVMVRKLLESLIIECFEKHNIQSKIQNSTGNYFYLDDLISTFEFDKSWTITRNTKQGLPKIKKLADMSAHSRRFNAKKNDIDQLKIELRTVIEELIHIADY